MAEKLYTVEQIAAMIKMHPKTIQRYIREDRLKAKKIGKAWRVSGHDLSVFLEGANDKGEEKEVPGLQKVITAASNGIKVSTVIDIPVSDNAAASRITGWLTAALNSKTDIFGATSMTSQYLMSEKTLRIMLWGSLPFTEGILASLREIGTEQGE